MTYVVKDFSYKHKWTFHEDSLVVMFRREMIFSWKLSLFISMFVLSLFKLNYLWHSGAVEVPE